MLVLWNILRIWIERMLERETFMTFAGLVIVSRNYGVSQIHIHWLIGLCYFAKSYFLLYNCKGKVQPVAQTGLLSIQSQAKSKRQLQSSPLNANAFCSLAMQSYAACLLTFRRFDEISRGKQKHPRLDPRECCCFLKDYSTSQ